MRALAWFRQARRAVGAVSPANALRDLHIYGGLALIGVAGWFGHLWPAPRLWVALAVGAILMLFGLLAPSRRDG